MTENTDKDQAVYKKSKPSKSGNRQKTKLNDTEYDTGIFVKIDGTYYAKSTGSCIPKYYEAEIKLIDDIDYELPDHRRLHQIAFKTLGPHYFKTHPDKYPDFGGIRQCYLKDVIIREPNKDAVSKPLDRGVVKSVDTMNLDELVRYCVKHDLDCDVRGYSTIHAARQGVMDEMENRKLAELDQLTADQKVLKERELANEDVQEILDFNNIA